MAWNFGGGGDGLTSQQQGVVDSVANLENGQIPQVKDGKFVKSIAKQVNESEIVADGEISVSKDTLKLGQGLEISEDGGAIKFKDNVSGVEYIPAGISLNADGTTGSNFATKRKDAQTITLQSNDDETHSGTLEAFFPVTSTRIIRKIVMRFANSANKVRITLRRASNNTDKTGIILYQSHTDAQFAAGQGLTVNGAPSNTEITLPNSAKVVSGGLVYAKIEQGTNATGSLSIKGSTETIGGINQFYPYLQQAVVTEESFNVATIATDATSDVILKLGNNGKLEQSSLSENATEISSNKTIKAKKFKTKNRSIEIGPNFSVGNSADELEFIDLSTGKQRTTGHTTYTTTGGTVNNEHFNTRRVWDIDSGVIQSDSTQNSGDYIGTGANTVSGEYRAIINTAHIAFPPMVQHYFVKMASDSLGCQLQVFEGSALSSPLIYESSDSFDFEAKVGAHGRIEGQALTGTISVTNGSATVTGVGTAFTTELKTDDCIRLTGQGNVEYVVKSVESDTSLTLVATTPRTLPAITASNQVFVRGDTLIRTPGGFTFEPNKTYFVRVRNKDNNVNIKGKVGALGQTGQFFFYFERAWQDVEFPEIPTAAHHHVRHLTQVYSGTGSMAQGGTTVTGSSTNFQTDFQVGDCFDLNGQVFTIKSIESNTSLTTNETATNATNGVGIYRHGDYIKWLDDAGREVLKVDQRNNMSIDNNLTIKGDLNVEGTTNTISSETLNVANNHILVNDGYTAANAKTGGLVVNYLPTATVDTGSAFTAGVASTSNPTITTTGSGTFSAGSFILVSNSTNNDGIYEVLSHTGTTLTIRGVGLTATVEDFTKNQVVTGGGSFNITNINVSILRAGSDGKWEQAQGSASGLVFKDLQGELPTLTEGSIIFRGASDLAQDNANLFWKDDTNRLGIKTNDPKAVLHAKGSALIGERYTNSETAASVPGNFTGVIGPTNRTGSQTGTEPVFRMIRDGESGTKYNMTADFNLGTDTAGIAAKSHLTLRMGDGNTHTPDKDVMHFYSDQSAGVGRLGVGKDKPDSNKKLHVIGEVYCEGSNSGLNLSNRNLTPTPGIVLRTDDNTAIGDISSDVVTATASAPSVTLRKYRGTLAAPTATQAGDELGALELGGHNGSNVINGARIRAEALGNWSATNRGTKLEFFTSQEGNFPLLRAMTIEGNRDVNVEGNFNANGSVTAGGVVGTNTVPFADNERLRVTASSADTQDNSRAASIDLHGNQHPNAGRLDLVGGGNADITFWSGGFQRGTVSGTTGYWGIGSDTAPTVGLDMVGTSLLGGSIRNRTYTNDNSVGNFTQIKYRGNQIAPAAIQLGDFISDMRFGGFDGIQDALGFQMFATATEAWTNTNRGSQFTIASSKTGTTALDNAFRIDGDNNCRVYEHLAVDRSITTGNDNGGRLVLGRIDNVNEGGEIQFTGAGTYDNWTQDVFQSSMRFSVTSATDSTVQLRNQGVGNVNLSLDGRIGTGGITNPRAEIQTSNSLNNRKVVLYESFNNDHQYFGFGINGGTLRYQVDQTGNDHKFYAGTGTTTSNLLTTIHGNGNLTVEGSAAIKGGSPAAGKKLTATDANGNAQWDNASTGEVIGAAGTTITNAATTLVTISLPRAGKYLVRGYARYTCNNKDSWSVIKLRDTTNNTDVANSENILWSTTALMQVSGTVDSFITVTGSTDIALQAQFGDAAWTGGSQSDINGRVKLMYQEL